MSLRRLFGLILTALVTGALLAAVGAMVALSASWDGADPVTMVSVDEDILKWGRATLTVDADEPVVVWAGGTITQGIYTAKPVAGTWATQLTSSTLGAWAPEIAVGRGTRLKAWMYGDEHLRPDMPWSLVVQEGDGAPETVATELYGEGLPSIAIGDSGFHLLYAATKTKVGTAFYPDLYYTFRPFAESAWRSPTIVVAHDAVLADNAIAGGVENARMALAGSTVHVVWEQKQILVTTEVEVEHTIWHIAGPVVGGTVVWGKPTRLSPPDQRITARPSIAAGPDGRVHVAWTELVGSRDNPEAQHVFYRALDDVTLTPLNPPTHPIRVNGRLPNKAAVAIAVHENLVCAVWHGYYDDGLDTMEDIHLRCSHDQGQTWEMPVTVSDSAAPFSSIFPALGFGDQGRVHVAWTEYQLVETSFVPYRIFYRRGDVRESPTVFLPLVSQQR